MQVVILCNHIGALPSISYLHTEKLLAAVVTTVGEGKNQIESFCELQDISCLKTSNLALATGVADFLKATKPDLVLVFGFSQLIPSQLFDIPALGFFNIHFSLLPAYRGPAPLFWQLKNGETKTGITIYKMNARFDAGPVVIQQEVPMLPEENFGLLSVRLSMLTVNLIEEAIGQLETGNAILKPQDEAEVSYFPKIAPADIIINWQDDSASEIMNLVNACNPAYIGAMTTWRGQQLYIIEVSPASIADAGFSEPGTIVYADNNYGLFVACKHDAFLRINVVQTAEGTLSGYKLVNLGLQPGEIFETFKIPEAVF